MRVLILTKEIPDDTRDLMTVLRHVEADIDGTIVAPIISQSREEFLVRLDDAAILLKEHAVR